MSIFNAGIERNQGGGIKKEDAILIDIKVKGQKIIYGKVETDFKFIYNNGNSLRDNWFYVSDHFLSKEEISKICLDNGVNLSSMTKDNWGSKSYWEQLSNACCESKLQAKDSYDGEIVETHTYKKTDDNCYLIHFTLHWGNGDYRSFYLPIILDIVEYRKEVGYAIKVPDYIDGELETLLDPQYWNDDFKFKWKMTREEWMNDDNFSQISSYVEDQRELLKFEGYSF